MASVKELQALLKAAKTEETKTKRATKRSKIPMANHTDSIAMERRPESAKWGVDHALLRFCDAESKPLSGRLDPEDTTGQEYRLRIVEYAKEHRVGNSKLRFDTKLGAWKGRADMFPPEFLDACEYVIETY